MAVPPPPKATSFILYFIKTHPLLVAWISVLTGLCFATGVAVSMLLDPRVSHSWNQPGLRTLDPDLPRAAQLDSSSSTLPDDPTAQSASSTSPGEPLASAQSPTAQPLGTPQDRDRPFITTASGSGVGDRPGQPLQPGAPLDPPQKEPGSPATTPLDNNPGSLVIIAPAQSVPRRASAPGQTAAPALNPVTPTPGDSLANPAPTGSDSSSSPHPSHWLLGVLGLGLGLGALGISRILVAELRESGPISPLATAYPSLVPPETPSPAVPIAPVPPIVPPTPQLATLTPPVAPPPVTPGAIASPPPPAPSPIAQNPLPPTPPAPRTSRLDPRLDPRSGFWSALGLRSRFDPPAPPSSAKAKPPAGAPPHREVPIAPPAPPNPSYPPLPSLADQADLRKRRSPFSWFDH